MSFSWYMKNISRKYKYEEHFISLFLSFALVSMVSIHDFLYGFLSANKLKQLFSLSMKYLTIFFFSFDGYCIYFKSNHNAYE